MDTPITSSRIKVRFGASGNCPFSLPRLELPLPELLLGVAKSIRRLRRTSDAGEGSLGFRNNHNHDNDKNSNMND